MDGEAWARAQGTQGAAHAACRETLECVDCPSGYCWTDVAKLIPHCQGGEHPARFRFTGGALGGAGGVLHLSCRLAG